MIGCAAAAALNDGAEARTGFCWCYLLCYGIAHLCSRAAVVLVQAGIVSSAHVHAAEHGGSQQHHQRLITRLQLSSALMLSKH